MPTVFRKTVLSIALVLVVTGCGAHRLHQAQDIYNQAARIEAQVSFEDTQAAGDPLTGDVQALQGYRSALALTNEALDKYDGSLKKDQLYGTALMLKALCQWRVSALDRQADANAVKALVAQIEGRVQSEHVVLGTRDQVLLKALPGLHEHEMGLRQHDRRKAARLFQSALETMEMALDQVNPPQDHPIRAYIRLSQMRALRAWRWVSLPDEPQDITERRQWHQQWNHRYETYRNALAPLLLANPGLNNRVETMDRAFGYQAQ